MTLLDGLNEKYDKEAQDIESLIDELNSEGQLNSKKLVEFLSNAFTTLNELTKE